MPKPAASFLIKVKGFCRRCFFLLMLALYSHYCSGNITLLKEIEDLLKNQIIYLDPTDNRYHLSLLGQNLISSPQWSVGFIDQSYTPQIIQLVTHSNAHVHLQTLGLIPPALVTYVSAQPAYPTGPYAQPSYAATPIGNPQWGQGYTHQSIPPQASATVYDPNTGLYYTNMQSYPANLYPQQYSTVGQPPMLPTGATPLFYPPAPATQQPIVPPHPPEPPITVIPASGVQESSTSNPTETTELNSASTDSPEEGSSPSAARSSDTPTDADEKKILSPDPEPPQTDHQPPSGNASEDKKDLVLSDADTGSNHEDQPLTVSAQQDTISESDSGISQLNSESTTDTDPQLLNSSEGSLTTQGTSPEPPAETTPPSDALTEEAAKDSSKQPSPQRDNGDTGTNLAETQPLTDPVSDTEADSPTTSEPGTTETSQASSTVISSSSSDTGSTSPSPIQAAPQKEKEDKSKAAQKETEWTEVPTRVRQRKPANPPAKRENTKTPTASKKDSTRDKKQNSHLTTAEQESLAKIKKAETQRKTVTLSVTGSTNRIPGVALTSAPIGQAAAQAGDAEANDVTWILPDEAAPLSAPSSQSKPEKTEAKREPFKLPKQFLNKLMEKSSQAVSNWEPLHYPKKLLSSLAEHAEKPLAKTTSLVFSLYPSEMSLATLASLLGWNYLLPDSQPEAAIPPGPMERSPDTLCQFTQETIPGLQASCHRLRSKEKFIAAALIEAFHERGLAVHHFLVAEMRPREGESINTYSPIGFASSRGAPLRDTPVFVLQAPTSLIVSIAESLARQVDKEHLSQASSELLDPVSQTLLWCGFPMSHSDIAAHSACTDWVAGQIQNQQTDWYTTGLHQQYLRQRLGLQNFNAGKDYLGFQPVFLLEETGAVKHFHYLPRVLKTPEYRQLPLLDTPFTVAEGTSSVSVPAQTLPESVAFFSEPIGSPWGKSPAVLMSRAEPHAQLVKDRIYGIGASVETGAEQFFAVQGEELLSSPTPTVSLTYIRDLCRKKPGCLAERMANGPQWHLYQHPVTALSPQSQLRNPLHWLAGTLDSRTKRTFPAILLIFSSGFLSQKLLPYHFPHGITPGNIVGVTITLLWAASEVYGIYDIEQPTPMDSSEDPLIRNNQLTALVEHYHQTGYFNKANMLSALLNDREAPLGYFVSLHLLEQSRHIFTDYHPLSSLPIGEQKKLFDKAYRSCKKLGECNSDDPNHLHRLRFLLTVCSDIKESRCPQLWNEETTPDYWQIILNALDWPEQPMKLTPVVPGASVMLPAIVILNTGLRFDLLVTNSPGADEKPFSTQLVVDGEYYCVPNPIFKDQPGRTACTIHNGSTYISTKRAIRLLLNPKKGSTFTAVRVLSIANGIAYHPHWNRNRTWFNHHVKTIHSSSDKCQEMTTNALRELCTLFTGNDVMMQEVEALDRLSKTLYRVPILTIRDQSRARTLEFTGTENIQELSAEYLLRHLDYMREHRLASVGHLRVLSLIGVLRFDDGREAGDNLYHLIYSGLGSDKGYRSVFHRLDCYQQRLQENSWCQGSTPCILLAPSWQLSYEEKSILLKATPQQFHGNTLEQPGQIVSVKHKTAVAAEPGHTYSFSTYHKKWLTAVSETATEKRTVEADSFTEGTPIMVVDKDSTSHPYALYYIRDGQLISTRCQCGLNVYMEY